MSSAPAVLQVGLNDQSRPMQLNKIEDAFFRSETWYDNPVAIFSTRMH